MIENSLDPTISVISCFIDNWTIWTLPGFIISIRIKATKNGFPQRSSNDRR